MRIRKEVSHWNVKMFIRLTLPELFRKLKIHLHGMLRLNNRDLRSPLF